MNAPLPALFVTSRDHLNGRSGGVQICTREYWDVLTAAGFDLTAVMIDPDRRLVTRARRRILRYEYRNLFDFRAAARVVEGARQGRAFVFLNHRLLAPIAGLLRPGGATPARFVLLSHGLASVDHLHAMNGSAGAVSAWLLGRYLADERKQNAHLERVFCLAPFETGVERWLGAAEATHLPRLVTGRPLPWRPEPGRLGFVGRLDHGPNGDGLTAFLGALRGIAPPDVRVRVVGAPAEAGRDLARAYPPVEYLGALGDRELEREAASWSCLVHPLFCHARGCSTKLGVALGWGTPIVTTPAGCRGYVWREGRLAMADDPEGLARLALRALDPDERSANRRETLLVAGSTPTLADVAGIARAALLGAGADAAPAAGGRRA